MKNGKYKIILCEGETDQILIGSYLGKRGNWHYSKVKKIPITAETINWFVNAEDEFLGIWQVGGNDFTFAVDKVLETTYFGSSIQKLAIVTDHDDVDAETIRPSKLLSIIGERLNMIVSSEERWRHRRARQGVGRNLDERPIMRTQRSGVRMMGARRERSEGVRC